MSGARLSPVTPGDLDQRQRQFLAPFTSRNGKYPNLFGTFAHHMDIADAWSQFGLYTMRHSSLDPALREILILRVALNSACEYEWHHHHAIALRAGLTEEQVRQIRERRPTAEAAHNLLLRCADELNDAKCLDEDTWAAMTDAFGVQQTIDVIFTVGAYSALALFINSCGVQIES